LDIKVHLDDFLLKLIPVNVELTLCGGILLSKEDSKSTVVCIDYISSEVVLLGGKWVVLILGEKDAAHVQLEGVVAFPVYILLTVKIIYDILHMSIVVVVVYKVEIVILPS